MISDQHKFHIACATVRRRFGVFWDRYPQDARQEAHLFVLLHKKHMTVRELFRAADRHFYEAAKKYGFRRTYLPGNQKSPLAQRLT